MPTTSSRFISVHRVLVDSGKEVAAPFVLSSAVIESVSPCIHEGSITRTAIKTNEMTVWVTESIEELNVQLEHRLVRPCKLKDIPIGYVAFVPSKDATLTVLVVCHAPGDRTTASGMVWARVVESGGVSEPFMYGADLVVLPRLA